MWFIMGLISSVVCFAIAYSKDYPSGNCWAHAAGGFLLSIIWIIVAACLPRYVDGEALQEELSGIQRSVADVQTQVERPAPPPPQTRTLWVLNYQPKNLLRPVLVTLTQCGPQTELGVQFVSYTDRAVEAVKCTVQLLDRYDEPIHTQTLYFDRLEPASGSRRFLCAPPVALPIPENSVSAARAALAELNRASDEAGELPCLPAELRMDLDAAVRYKAYGQDAFCLSEPLPGGGWLCCCGRKNDPDDAACPLCGRRQPGEDAPDMTRFYDAARELSSARAVLELFDTLWPTPETYPQPSWTELRSKLDQLAGLERIYGYEDRSVRRILDSYCHSPG